MTAVDYRAGISDDAEELAALFTRSFCDTFGHLYPPEDLSAFLATVSPEGFREKLVDPRVAFRVAVSGPQIAGYVRLGPPSLPVETPPDTIELAQLYVLTEWHGTGAAAALMDWALREARARGARHMQLSVYVDNHRARRFYERYGFVSVGRYDFMVGRHADEDIVLRHLVMQADE